MPIYEYRCERGHSFEVMQRMTDDPLTSCQTCEAPAQRVLHPVAVHFKGKGFYNTDYGTRKRNREKAAASASENGGAKSDSAKTESAGPESKSDSKPAGDSKPAAAAKSSD